MEKHINTEKCCFVTCDVELGETYWNNQYDARTTGWDLGEASPPLKCNIDQLTNKKVRILIPGCGNTYEADYLLEKGFTNVTVIDISPTLVEHLKNKFATNSHIKIELGDFFVHTGQYDLILEQTFFCAISATMRKNYVKKMTYLLATGGKLVGVLFDKEFEHQGPPFGGCKCQYIPLFKNEFQLKYFGPCYNSFEKRKDTELFMILVKK